MKPRRRGVQLVMLLAALALVAAACGDDDSDGTTTTVAAAETTTTAAGDADASDDDLTFGMIMVGPENDRGWSQAHFEAGKYLEEKLGATMISLDSVNTTDRPETSVEQVVDDMIAQGAQLIFATSDDMRDGIEAAAAAHPDVPMIWSSGDSAWEEGEAYRADLSNLGNIMGQMYWGKFIAGCAAALTTETGKIAYLGPLINDETRRLANSVYLGAQYCYENYRGEDPASLDFEVNWIGFWFNIPGVTLDPTEVTNAFFDGGADVVVSGIDTTEALVRAGQRAAAGETVWAIPYDFEDACAEAPEVCLGVPYFNWGPSYLETATSAIVGSYASQFRWLGPDWAEMNNPDTSMIGWFDGEGLSDDAAASLSDFIAGLAGGDIDLFVGPLNYQDGSEYIAAGEKATPVQLWYTKQLLEGVVGASSS
jgi:simple sugar transport system substrate-binding protein